MMKLFEKENTYVTQVRQVLNEKSLKFTYELKDKDKDTCRHVYKIIIEYSESLV